VREENGKTYTALLFCTDIDCAALDILRYYKARFQIEFVFRDAKQYTGLCDCQATSPGVRIVVASNFKKKIKFEIRNEKI